MESTGEIDTKKDQKSAPTLGTVANVAAVGVGTAATQSLTSSNQSRAVAALKSQFFKYASIEHAKVGSISRYDTTATPEQYAQGPTLDFKTWATIPAEASAKDPTQHVHWFVATEKVHGSNFSIITDGAHMVGAKHSAVLKDEDKAFFDNARVMETQRGSIQALHAHLKQTFAGIHYVIVFGELCGGGYYDPKRRTTEHIGVKKAVQPKPWYSKDVRFYAFDIYLPEKAMFLSYHEALPLLDKFGFLYAKPLFVDTAKQLMARLKENDRLETTQTWIPQALGLPVIEGNFIEGMVLRNLFPIRGENKRIIRKMVTKRFRESHGSAEPDKYTKLEMPKEFENKTHAELLAIIKTGLTDLVTSNRMEHVFSKVWEFPADGDYRKQQIWYNAMYGRFCGDVIKDFQKVAGVGALWSQCDASDAANLMQYVKVLAKPLVRKYVENKPKGLGLGKEPGALPAGENDEKSSQQHTDN